MLWKMNEIWSLNIFSCIILRVHPSLYSFHVICWLVLTVSEHLHVRLVQKSFWICFLVWFFTIFFCGWSCTSLCLQSTQLHLVRERTKLCMLPTPNNKRKQLFMSSSRAKTHIYTQIRIKICIHQFVYVKKIMCSSITCP